jgi:predicted CopG family antitoxin
MKRKMMTKIYQVRGIIDPTCGEPNFDDIGTVHAEFKTKKEAESFCDFINEYYSQKCKIWCEFEIAEIDLDNLDNVETLKADFNARYKEEYEEE